MPAARLASSARSRAINNLDRISLRSCFVSPCLACASQAVKLSMIFSRDTSPAAYCFSHSRIRRFIRLMEE